MAHFTNGFGSGIVGKLGNSIFYLYKGKNCVRSMPTRNNKTCTPLQEQNKLRFMEMQKFARKFKYEVIPQIWNQGSKTLSGYQLFLKTNKVIFDAQGNITDPKKIQLSVGKLHLPEGIAVKRREEGSTLIDVSWIQDFNGGEMAYWDELMVIGAGDGQYSQIASTAIRRGENQGSFTLPELKTPITHLYLFFCSLDKRNYSGSICLELGAN